MIIQTILAMCDVLRTGYASDHHPTFIRLRIQKRFGSSDSDDTELQDDLKIKNTAAYITELWQTYSGGEIRLIEKRWDSS